MTILHGSTVIIYSERRRAMQKTLIIEDIKDHRDFIPILADWHFREFGELCGAPSEEKYRDMLMLHIREDLIPSTFVATGEKGLIGSVSLVTCDMTIMPHLTPWMARLYIHPPFREQGSGSELVEAAVQACQSSCSRLYLYASGDLIRFYTRLGWEIFEEDVFYGGSPQTIMEYVMH